MDLELAGKVAIVTGGSRGIGKAIARELADEGVDVAIVARDVATLEATAAELGTASGARILPVQADTSHDDAVRNMVRRVMDTFGRVDILVAAAATPALGPVPKLAEITDAIFWDDVNVKVMGYLRCAREVAPHMVRQGWGRIVMIAGLNARNTGSTIGSLRNAAVVALAKNLADELGPHGINVTVVHPSTTRTERTPELIATQAQQLGISEAEAERRLAQNNSIRQLLDARHVAYVVTFLASPKSLAINGEVIAAGGGIGPGIYY